MTDEHEITPDNNAPESARNSHAATAAAVADAPPPADAADHQEQVLQWRGQLQDTLDRQDSPQARNLLRSLREIDRAEVIYELDSEHLQQALALLSDRALAESLDDLDRDEALALAQRMDPQRLAAALRKAPIDLVADIVRGLDWEQSSRLLHGMPAGEMLGDILLFDDDKAGGIMSPDVVALQQAWPVAHAINVLRSSQTHPENIRQLFAVDTAGKLVGWLELSQLIFAKPGSRVRDLMNKDIIAVGTHDDQELAANLAQRYDLLSVPVIDAEGLLKGAITGDDLARVAEQEATEKIHRIAGIGADDGVKAPIRSSVLARLPWLGINIAAVALVAGLISLFESTVTSYAILVSHMAMVMNQTGVIGNQVNILIIRALAVGDATPRDVLPLLRRELIVLSINGVMVAAVTGLFVGIWRLNPALGILVAAASLLSYILATAAAVLIPLAMRRLRLDPAASSGTILPTLTDIFGSITFLLLATVFLTLLVE